MKKKKVPIFIAVVLALMIAGLFMWMHVKNSGKGVSSFSECVRSTNQIDTSYPEQCVFNGRTFTNPSRASELNL